MSRLTGILLGGVNLKHLFILVLAFFLTQDLPAFGEDAPKPASIDLIEIEGPQAGTKSIWVLPYWSRGTLKDSFEFASQHLDSFVEKLVRLNELPRAGSSLVKQGAWKALLKMTDSSQYKATADLQMLRAILLSKVHNKVLSDEALDRVFELEAQARRQDEQRNSLFGPNPRSTHDLVLRGCIYGVSKTEPPSKRWFNEPNYPAECPAGIPERYPQKRVRQIMKDSLR